MTHDLYFDLHARVIAKTCNYHLELFRCIRSLFNLERAKSVACAVIRPCLDHVNFVYTVSENLRSRSFGILIKQLLVRCHGALKLLHCFQITCVYGSNYSILSYDVLDRSQPSYLS